jgi:hypothetical protein
VIEKFEKNARIGDLGGQGGSEATLPEMLI